MPAYTTTTATPDPSLICDVHRRILNPLSEARVQTHVLMDTSGFDAAEPKQELPITPKVLSTVLLPALLYTFDNFNPSSNLPIQFTNFK